MGNVALREPRPSDDAEGHVVQAVVGAVGGPLSTPDLSGRNRPVHSVHIGVSVHSPEAIEGAATDGQAPDHDLSLPSGSASLSAVR